MCFKALASLLNWAKIRFCCSVYLRVALPSGTEQCHKCVRIRVCVDLYAAVFVHSHIWWKPSDFIIYKWIGRAKKLWVCANCVVGKSGGRFWCETHWKRKMNVILLLSVAHNHLNWMHCARCAVLSLHPFKLQTYTERRCVGAEKKIMCKKCNSLCHCLIEHNAMGKSQTNANMDVIRFDAMRWGFRSFNSILSSFVQLFSPLLILHHFCIIIDAHTDCMRPATESSGMKCQLTNDIIFYLVRMDWETFNGRTIICFYWISAMTINWLTGKTVRLSEAPADDMAGCWMEWVYLHRKKGEDIFSIAAFQSQQTVNRTICNWKFEYPFEQCCVCSPFWWYFLV